MINGGKEELELAIEDELLLLLLVGG